MKALPPLKALHYFDVAMRHGSFALAAQELFVTPGAVGQQIRNLEQWLGLALFTRNIRQVAATPEGLRYWQRIQPALNQIADASSAVRDSLSNSARITMPPTLAAKWFARRMSAFVAELPEVALHLSSSTALADFASEAIDLAVRYFHGTAPGLEVHLLYRDEARAYCAPAYQQRFALNAPADLARATLLHTTLLPHWPRWLAEHGGLEEVALAQLGAMHFDQSLLSIDAAKREQGVVLTSPMLVEDEVEAGLLIEPFTQRLTLDRGYYLVHPRSAQLSPAVQQVKQWLIAQTGP